MERPRSAAVFLHANRAIQVHGGLLLTRSQTSAEIVAGLDRIRDELLRLPEGIHLEQQTEFSLSNEQFKELIEQLKKVGNAPIHVTAAGAVFEGFPTATPPTYTEGYL